MKKLFYLLVMVLVASMATSCRESPNLANVFFTQDTLQNITEVRLQGNGRLLRDKTVFNKEETFSITTDTHGRLIEFTGYHKNGNLAVAIKDTIKFYDIDGYVATQSKFRTLYPDVYTAFLEKVHQIHEITYKY